MRTSFRWRRRFAIGRCSPGSPTCRRGSTRLGVCGRIATPRTALALLQGGVDFVFVGRTAILHPDWPVQARDIAFEPNPTPVTADYLANQGLGARFIRYLRTFENFVEAA